jgi:hypothetical protein
MGPALLLCTLLPRGHGTLSLRETSFLFIVLIRWL